MYSEYEILNTFNRDENSVGKYMFDSNENKMKLNLFMHLIKWPGNQNQKPAGFYVPKHLKVSTIAEKPFVWTKKLLRGEKCAENQIICPRFNKTKKKDDNFNDKEAYIDYFCCEGYCIDLRQFWNCMQLVSVFIFKHTSSYFSQRNGFKTQLYL